MGENIEVRLTGRGPWGFRMKGGKEFNSPISVESVTSGGKASSGGLHAGDKIISINGSNTENLNHQVAKNLISGSTETLTLVIARPQPGVAQPTAAKAPQTFTTTQVTTSAPFDKDFNPKLVTLESNKPVEEQNKINNNTKQEEKTQIQTDNKSNNSDTGLSHSTKTPSPSFLQLQQTLNTIQGINNSQQVDVSTSPKTASTETPSTGSSAITPQSNKSNEDDKSRSLITVRDTSNVHRQGLGLPESKEKQDSSLKDKTNINKCHTCGNFITSTLLRYGDKAFHPEHFLCEKCKKNLHGLGFYEDKDKMYCKDCYGLIFAPKCDRCGKACIDKYVSACDKSYHTECFVCLKCKLSLSGLSFSSNDGEPYCQACSTELFSSKCSICQKNIVPGQKYLECDQSVYHELCFTCHVCKLPLIGKGVVKTSEGKYQCSTH